MCTQLCTHAGPPRGIHCALTTAGVYSCASNARPYLGTWGTCTLCTATGIKFCTRSESVRMFPWSFSAALPHPPHLVPLRPSEILLVAPHESSESTPSPGIQNPGSGKQYSSPGIPVRESVPLPGMVGCSAIVLIQSVNYIPGKGTDSKKPGPATRIRCPTRLRYSDARSSALGYHGYPYSFPMQGPSSPWSSIPQHHTQFSRPLYK